MRKYWIVLAAPLFCVWHNAIAKTTYLYLQNNTYFANSYKPVASNVELLKSIKSDLSPLKIASVSAAIPGEDHRTCRASFPIYSPGKKAYETVLADALAGELNQAGIYADADGIPIDIFLDKMDFSSFGTGGWTIEATLSVPGHAPLKVSHTITFDVSLIAVTACGTVNSSQYRAIQEFLYAVYSDPGFKEMAKVREIPVQDNPASVTSVPPTTTLADGQTNDDQSISGLFSAAHQISNVDGDIMVKDFVNIDRSGKMTVYLQGMNHAGQECYVLASGSETNASLQGRVLAPGKSPLGDPDYEIKIGDDIFGILKQRDTKGGLQWFFYIKKFNKTYKVTGAGNAVQFLGQFYALNGKVLESPTLDQLQAKQCADGVALGKFDHTRYAINGGEIYDKTKNLTWKRCSVGQQWTNVAGCDGTTVQYKFDDARKLADGLWRVPTKEELSSLIDFDRAQRQLRPTIDVDAFPNMDDHKMAYWSSTAIDNDEAWAATFFGGRMFHGKVSGGLYSIRLVREGP